MPTPRGALRRVPAAALAAMLAATMALAGAAARADHQRQGLDAAESSLPVFADAMRQRMTFSLGWRAEVTDVVAWRAAGLAKARELMLPGPAGAAAVPFAPRIVDEIDRGTYLARKLEFNLDADSRVLALMLVPKGAGPFPAALLLHDHGARFDIGKEKLVRPWGDAARESAAQQWVGRYFGQRFPGDELARRGYVVLAVDALGWGDRSAPGFSRDSQQALASNLFNLGSSWAAVIADEDRRAAQFLAGRPEVDRMRVAAVGFSMGAFRAWQVAALSDDITASVAVCWMATMPALMVPGNNQLRGQSSFAMLHPLLGRYLDYPDVAALAAPKPMLVYAGEQDSLFPLPAVRAAFDKMAGVWSAHRAADLLHTRLWPLGHVFEPPQQEAAFDWLDARFSRARR